MAEKIRLPSSEGGLVSYSGEASGSKFPLKPEYALGIIIATMILIIIINVIF